MLLALSSLYFCSCLFGALHVTESGYFGRSLLLTFSRWKFNRHYMRSNKSSYCTIHTNKMFLFWINILIFNFLCLLHVSNPRVHLQADDCIYRGADKPDQEGYKLQRQKILMFIYPIYYHYWRNISTIYIYIYIYSICIYNKTSIKTNILTIKENTWGSRLG